MRRFICGMTAIAAAIICFQGALAQKVAAKKISFPLVFTSDKELAKFGLSTSERAPMLHQCYYYGAGGQLISLSHERLLRYRESGFTLNSLCLGLMSSSLFDPETGSRLPTYIVVDPKALARNKVSDVDVTYEHPLELPPCFRRALVYADCVFNYDRLTGVRLSAEKTQAFRELGIAINDALQRAMEKRLACKWPYCVERRSDSLSPGSLAAGGYGATSCSNEGYLQHFIESTLAQHGITVPNAVLDDAHLSCFDISINLAEGYGYTMDADGTAGPSVSSELLSAAIDPKRRMSRIDPKALADLLNAQRPVTSAAKPPN